jgi:4,5-dihydroxyphthalate decarboxylase
VSPASLSPGSPHDHATNLVTRESETRMTASRLRLSIALSANPNTRAILDGGVEAQGIELVPTALHPSEMFWRQLRFGDFDVSEMSMSSLLIATARGPTPWVALPVFTTREFFHTRILVRVGAGIESPSGLKGRRVGVPEYQQTAAIWGRGVLQHEFGVHARDIEWFMERNPDRSHGGATGFVAPAGVRVNQIPPSSSIGDMLARGELDATLLYLTDPNLVDRSRVDVSEITRPLFDREAEGRRYFAKTGLYQINHGVVVRRALIEQHPWIALNLYAAFVAAKNALARQAEDRLKPYLACGLIGDDVRRALARDPTAYGVKAARSVLETIADYVFEQGLTGRRVKLEELFAPSTMDL